MNLIKLQCPNCNSPLETDAERDYLFCQYCGTKILLNDVNVSVNKSYTEKVEHTVRHIDEAKVAEELTKQANINLKKEKLKQKHSIGYWITLPFKVIGILMAVILALVMIINVKNDYDHKQRMKEIEEKGYIAAGDDYFDYRGRNYKAVVGQLEGNGFTNIEEVDLNDADKKEDWEDGEVSSVSIGGDSDFFEGDYFDPNSKVVVTYH